MRDKNVKCNLLDCWSFWYIRGRVDVIDLCIELNFGMYLCELFDFGLLDGVF